MADTKISALTAHTAPIPTDVIPIVDVTANETKKMTMATLKTWALYDFGNGVDGDVTFSVNTDITTEKQYANITVDAGVIVRVLGVPLKCSGKLTIAATGNINANGSIGTDGNTSGGAIGDTAASYTAVSPWISAPAGGVGTAGGGVNGTANGSGGAGGTPTLTQSLCPLLLQAGCGGGSGGAHGSSPPNGQTGLKSIGGAAGGAGGAGSGTTSSWGHGGNGGGGGGVLLLYINEIDNAGSITATGGTGGNGWNGSSKGGNGGGGGGGVVALFYKTASGSGVGTVTAAGGSPGTAGNGGASGSAGTVYTKQV